ncbi:MAG: hypothetical protein V3V61_08035 [Gammaproteobacteria bacterium]
MIILIRHATPQIEYGKCDYKVARTRLVDYNETKEVNVAEIDAIFKKIPWLETQPNNFTAFISKLPRALSTAEHVSGYLDFKKEYSYLYKEFDAHIIKLPFVKLKVRTWFLISRVAWFFGFKAGTRSFKSERERAYQCAGQLQELIAKGKSPILVAHGLFNYFVARKLKKNGWKICEFHKQGCFEVSQLKKV